jgi:hypothetical protein
MTQASRTLAAIAARGGALILLSPVVAAPAFAQLRTATDISVQGTAASGLSLANSSGDGAVSASIQVDPSIYYENGDATTAVVHGTASVEEYSGRLGTAVSLGLSGNVQQRLSDRTTLGLNASMSSTRSALRDFLRQPAVAADVLQGLDPDLLEAQGPQAGVAPGAPGGLDPDLFDPQYPDFIEAGLGGRTTSFRLGGKLAHRLSAVDSLSLGASVRWNRADDLGAGDYRSDDLSAFYTRILSPRASVDVGLTAGRVDYDGRSAGGQNDGTYLTPTIALMFKVSEAVTTNLALGASITRVDLPGGSQFTHTSLAGRFEVCRLQYRGTICANAARSVQPTSFAGLTTVTSASLTFGRAIGLDQRVSLAASYTRRNADLFPRASLLDGRQSLLAASARYSRSIGERLDAFVTPGYARIWGQSIDARDNYQISVGVRYRLGRLR